jgi:outer membrane receptor for ferrienterochelin and colicin
MKKLLAILIMALYAPFLIQAQVTTSSIYGTVSNDKNEHLGGATVRATHVPSGTAYSITTQADGRFTLSNMRVGGPYKVEVTFVGYTAKVYEEINLQLGTPLELDAVLENSAQSLTEVVVTGNQKNALISPEHMGPSVNISQAQLTLFPTVIRNVDDFARLTPQAQSLRSNTDGSTLGISFAGQNNRYNQFTVDGANATDVFGLANSGTNGGQASINPIPFDAIEQVQIILSPYDVTLSGFTGGGVNAVTRSGTNEFHGSAFGFNQNQTLVGKEAITNTPYGNFKDWNFGARLGGAFIKNKLFFFVDYEGERKSQPLSYVPGTAQSTITAGAMDSLSAFLQNKSLHPGWSYNPGAYAGFNTQKKSDAVFARIDWNIDGKNKLTVRHSLTTGYNYIFSDSRTAAAFYNNGYKFTTTTNSTVAELNSNISSRMSNVLRATVSIIRDARVTPGSLFPDVEIKQSSATYSFGTDAASQASSTAQNNYTITDNFNIYAGKHTITLGTDDEFYHAKDIFMEGLVGDYTYSSFANFYNDASGMASAYPSSYYSTYSTNPKNPIPAASVRADQLSLYAQDAWDIKRNFRLTYGLRADAPILVGKPAANATFNGSNIAMDNHVATDQIPKTPILLSPRVGFNWDINHNKQTQIRGGVGIFTGRAPFVWITNQYENTGVGTVYGNLSKAAQVEAAGVHFNPTNPYQPPATGTVVLNTTDQHFKYPRTLRGNLAIDQRLPYGFVGTVEAIYTKTIEDVVYHDLNLAPAATTVIVGNTTRPFYGQVVNPNFSNVINLGNTSKGYGYNFTAMLSRPYSNGWTGSIAYSLGHNYALLNATSDVALSNYDFAYNVNGLNNLDMGKSNFDLGSRIVGYVGKKFTYGKIFSTSVGLVYTGQSGQTFSYVYYGDLNGDAGTSPGTGTPTVGQSFYASTSSNASADLMYLPSDSSQFTPSGGLSAGQQFKAFQSYENSDKYLKKHIGKNTSINGDRTPWENHFDLKVAEAVALYKQHTLTITADVLNIGNLLSRTWGRSYYLAYQEAQPLNVDHLVVQANGQMKPYFTYDPTYGLDSQTNKPWSYGNYASRWSMQLGLRYSF